MVATRRAFLQAGGTVLAGLVGAPSIGPWRRGTTVDIYLRSDEMGGEVWFDPIGVFVEPGQTVRWINVRNVHTSTAYHPANGRALRIPDAAVAWDSGYLLHDGDTFTITPHAEGVYDYFCRPHEASGMVGRLVVGDPQPSPAPPFGPDVPAAARRALPPVAQIVRDGLVRR